MLLGTENKGGGVRNSWELGTKRVVDLLRTRQKKMVRSLLVTLLTVVVLWTVLEGKLQRQKKGSDRLRTMFLNCY